MKLKDLIFNREKLTKYDELKKWKDAFGNKEVKLSSKQATENDMEDLVWLFGLKVPDNIRKMIVDALEAEIEKLDESRLWEY